MTSFVQNVSENHSRTDVLVMREFLDSLEVGAFVTGDLLGSSAAATSNIWFPFAIAENDTMGRGVRQDGRQKNLYLRGLIIDEGLLMILPLDTSKRGGAALQRPEVGCFLLAFCAGLGRF
jgi:hypothetical protein